MIFLAVLLSCIACAVESAPESHKIQKLPGLRVQPSFKQYSGYLHGSDTARLHYWFVESQRSPAADPVLLWLNGGPGCSSLDGFLTENGPFTVTPTDKLIPNPYSWNTAANMIFLESPACVGFSYSTDGNCSASDDLTAEINHNALTHFLQLYPEYSKNAFLVSGESYAGYYLPMLSARLMKDPKFNFKGLTIGNPYSDVKWNTIGFAYTAYYHGIISDSNWTRIMDACCQNQLRNRCDLTRTNSSSCTSLLKVFSDIEDGKFRIDPYNIYGPCKVPTGKQSRKRVRSLNLFKSIINPNVKSNEAQDAPCTIDASAGYLNRQDVKKAINVDINRSWAMCNEGLNYKVQYKNMKPFYNKLFANKKLKILIYNGDADLICSYLPDEWFFESFNQEVLQQRRPWHYYDHLYKSWQVGGYLKQWKGFTLITVRGAGHMVPTNKPQPALRFLQSFIKWTSTGKLDL